MQKSKKKIKTEISTIHHFKDKLVHPSTVHEEEKTFDTRGLNGLTWA